MGPSETAIADRHWFAFLGSWFLVVIGALGISRGSLIVIGLPVPCPPSPGVDTSPYCRTDDPSSLVVGLLLAISGVTWSKLGADRFGVPAHPWALPLVFGSEAIILLLAATTLTSDLSLPHLLAGTLCGAISMISSFRPPGGKPRYFLGPRRLDGRDRAAYGLPAKDRVVISLAWALSLIASILFATALT